MELTRTVAFRLAKEGKLEVTQKGHVIPTECLASVRGPIRLRQKTGENSDK